MSLTADTVRARSSRTFACPPSMLRRRFLRVLHPTLQWPRRKVGTLSCELKAPGRGPGAFSSQARPALRSGSCAAHASRPSFSASTKNGGIDVRGVFPGRRSSALLVRKSFFVDIMTRYFNLPTRGAPSRRDCACGRDTAIHERAEFARVSSSRMSRILLSSGCASICS